MLAWPQDCSTAPAQHATFSAPSCRPPSRSSLLGHSRQISYFRPLRSPRELLHAHYSRQRVEHHGRRRPRRRGRFAFLLLLFPHSDRNDVFSFLYAVRGGFKPKPFGLRSMGDLESLIPQTQKELGAIIQKVPRYPHRILLRFLKRMPHKKRDNACTQVGIPAPRDPAVVAPSLPSLRVLHSLTLS